MIPDPLPKSNFLAAMASRMTSEVARIFELKGVYVIALYLVLFVTALCTLLLLANDELLQITAILTKDIRQKTRDNALIGYGKLYVVVTIIFFFTSLAAYFLVKGVNRLGVSNKQLITMFVSAFCHNLERYIEREMPDKVLLISFITVMIISLAACFHERDTTGMLDGVMVGFMDLTVLLLFFSEKSSWMEAVITFFVFGVAFVIKCTEVPAPAPTPAPAATEEVQATGND